MESELQVMKDDLEKKKKIHSRVFGVLEQCLQDAKVLQAALSKRAIESDQNGVVKDKNLIKAMDRSKQLESGIESAEIVACKLYDRHEREAELIAELEKEEEISEEKLIEVHKKLREAEEDRSLAETQLKDTMVMKCV
jgi:hypothetical protein